MARILVTGAAGFIGSHTVDHLLRAGHVVLGVDNFRTGRRENLRSALSSTAFSLLEGDMVAAGVIDQAVAGFRPDAIIHLAALVSVQESIAHPTLNFELNVHATQLTAEAARRHGVRRIVFASSAAVYGDGAALPVRESAEKRPVSPYGAAKLASEVLLLGHAAAYGLTVRCQRYFNVFGPRQDPSSPYSGVISIFERRHRQGEPVTLFGDGRQTRDFISVHDVARANVIAATRGIQTSGAANICTGHETSLLELIAILRKIYPAAPAPHFAPPRAGDIVRSCGAPDLGWAELEFRAECPLATGLTELAQSAQSS